MCGICGIAYLAGERGPDSEETVAAMMDRLGQRGPDGSWAAGDSSAWFGMTRLAIRGLDDGQQPIVDAETGVMVVCNGEIDNHQELRAFLAERGRSCPQTTDVAVLAGLYLELGDDFVGRLAGAYALAVWDPRRRRILLARDRAGERPLFYRQADGKMLFASQVSALSAGSPETPEPDAAALTRFLQAGYFTAPDSPFEGFGKVPPGTIVALDAGGIQVRRYWRWRDAPAKADADPEAAFDEVFRQAVLRQSEVDVDFGLFLSGGLDSSLVSAVTRRVRPDKALTAFGLRFSESSYDEGEFAERVAKDLGIDYVPVWVQPEDIPDILRELIEGSGEPLADPAWVPTALLARRAARDIKIALVGEGADELFAGYPTYFGARLAEYYRRLPAPLRAGLRRLVERVPPSDKKVTLSFLLKRFIQGEELDGLARHVLWTSSIAPPLLERLGLRAQPLPWALPGEGVLLDQLQQYDLERPLAEGLLTKADRASMQWALELRAPFLDPAVMEFAATLPPELRVRGIETKVFLKRFALRYLPKEIVYRKKRGLSVPLASWLRAPLKDWAESVLDRPDLERIGIDRAAVQGLFDEHQRRTADHARVLWTLIVLGEWMAWAAHSAKAPEAAPGRQASGVAS
jgi:asparagine synthase (glutamine-hydrolysing)